MLPNVVSPDFMDQIESFSEFRKQNEREILQGMGIPADLMGIPIIVSEFLPSWLMGTIGDVMMIRWNREYRELQAEKLRAKGWRVKVL